MWKSAAFSKRILAPDAENIELVSAGSLHLPDPVETGVTFQENALLKARAVAIRTGLPAVADDSGLIVDVMGNAPGILSARWAGAHGHDNANNALLLAQIEDIPDDKRTAALPLRRRAGGPGHRDRCRRDRWSGCRRHHRSHHGCRWEPCPVHARYAIKSETVELGDMPGRIIREARGEHGFGYDPLFVPDDQPAGRVSTEPDHEGEPADQRRDDSGREECDFPPRQGAESLGPRHRGPAALSRLGCLAALSRD